MIHTPCLGQEVFPIIKNNKGIWVPIPVVMLSMRRTMDHLDKSIPSTTEYRFSNHSLDKKIGPLPNWVSADNFFAYEHQAISECARRNPVVEVADVKSPPAKVADQTVNKQSDGPIHQSEAILSE